MAGNLCLDLRSGSPSRREARGRAEGEEVEGAGPSQGGGAKRKRGKSRFFEPGPGEGEGAGEDDPVERHLVELLQRSGAGEVLVAPSPGRDPGWRAVGTVRHVFSHRVHHYKVRKLRVVVAGLPERAEGLPRPAGVKWVAARNMAGEGLTAGVAKIWRLLQLDGGEADAPKQEKAAAKPEKKRRGAVGKRAG